MRRFSSFCAVLTLLAAGLVAAVPPPPPEVSGVRFEGVTLSWQPAPGAVAYRYYRSALSELPNACADGWSVTDQLGIDDVEVPPAGEGYAYLVAALNSAGDGSLGSTSGGTPRATLLDCDADLDGVPDGQDNCPVDANAGQQDQDNNGTGDACQFEASGVELRGRLELREIPGFQGRANDIGSYVSPSGEEYAIIGFQKGTAFVRVTDPSNPGLSGYVADPVEDDAVRDMAVYDHYAYIVSDGIGVGLQIVDLAGIDDDNVVLVNTTDLGVGFTNAHNVFVNSDSGFLYLAKPDIGDETGLTAVDLNVDPVNPTIAGFWTSSVICHDLYVTNHPSGQEIAFCFARNAGLRIVNVTFKLLMTELSFLFYPTVQLCHQGWLTDDFGYVVFGDEKDELDDPGVISTTTYVVDVSNLLDPTLTTTFTNGLPSIDHNLMIRGDFVYEANYTSGMRMFSLCNVDNIQEVGFVDTRPEDDVLTFQGAWSVDAQLPSGTIVVSDKERGLFVLDTSAALAAFNDKCSVGDPLDPVCDACVDQICAVDPACCSSAWDAQCIEQVRTVCNNLSCDESAGSCAHALCSEGGALTAGCDVPPLASSCVEAICQQDPGCCQVGWDADCVAAVTAVCGSSCD